jgi:Cu/Zn superoxide dismutase
MLSRTVPLIAIGGSRVSGFVQVTERNGSFVATVSARGLTPGLHTVHIHRGSCANPYAGVHLTVLGLLAADGSGAGTLTAGIGSV